MKVAVVTSIPTPYRDPFWNVVAKRDDIDLDVFYCAGGKQDRPWSIDWKCEFRAHALPSYNLLRFAGADASAYWVRGLMSEIRGREFDAVVVGGYNHPSMLQTIRHCARSGRPYFLMCETYRESRGWKAPLRNRLLKYICGRAAGGMPTGRAATDFLIRHGIPRHRLTLMPNVPDIAKLQKQAAVLRNDERLRERLGLPAAGRLLIFVGRMIPKKRPTLVVRAFARGATDGATLIMLGDGPLRAKCQSLADELGVADRVLFPGFVQPDRVSEYLCASDVFVLPSSETWGVAPIEAVSLGVPVILSDGVGCHRDLVEGEACGTVVPAGCEEALTEAIGVRLRLRTQADAVWRATPFLSRFTYERLAEDFAAGLGMPRADDCPQERSNC